MSVDTLLADMRQRAAEDDDPRTAQIVDGLADRLARLAGRLSALEALEHAAGGRSPAEVERAFGLLGELHRAINVERLLPDEPAADSAIPGTLRRLRQHAELAEAFRLVAAAFGLRVGPSPLVTAREVADTWRGYFRFGTGATLHRVCAAAGVRVDRDNPDATAERLCTLARAGRLAEDLSRSRVLAGHSGMHPITPADLLRYCNAIAHETALAAAAGPCGAHLLGARVHCPACWGWHVARKVEHADPAAQMAADMAGDLALRGEDHLIDVARTLLDVYQSASPPEPAFFERLAAAAVRAGFHVRPTSRRRSAVADYAGILFLERYVPVGQGGRRTSSSSTTAPHEHRSDRP